MTVPGIPQRVHLVGIGGAHMSAIAEILLQEGHTITGSDIRPSPVTDRLAARGASIIVGHQAANLGSAELVITTAAAKDDNPELTTATANGTPILSRAQMVAHLMRGRRSIAVAGTHGKTTTSGMVAHLLVEAGMDPTYLIGGDIPSLGGSWGVGRGEDFVVEADEYARAFLEYEPAVALVTNVEPDHLEYYGDANAVVDAFSAFVKRVRHDGLVVYCADSPLLASLIGDIQGDSVGLNTTTIQSYSTQDAGDWSIAGPPSPLPLGQSFEVVRNGDRYGRFTTRLAGRHNVANMLGVIAVAAHLGLPLETTQAALATYGGAKRRFEHVGSVHGVDLIDDFGHHPTEIQATLAAARQRYRNRRVVVAFQPHTYSRTQYLLNEFLTAFHDADVLGIVETYAARETPDQGMNAEQLCALLVDPHPTYIGSVQDVPAFFDRVTAPGDVFITLGAGDIGTMGPQILATHVTEVER